MFQTCRSIRRSVQPGHVRLTALPPPTWSVPDLGKWAITWSATITETAIVSSAWRRSWPWFQRSNVCWTTTPTTETIAAATSTGSTHSQVETSAPAIAKPPTPVIRCCTS